MAHLFAAVLLAVMLTAACAGGGGDGDDSASAGTQTVSGDETTSSSGVPSCAEEQHVVVVDWAGFLTASQDDWADWIQGLGEPEMRPGGPEVINAYRDRGYEILYITTVPPNVLIDDQPVPQAVEGWLERNGFPRDERARVFGFAGAQSDQPNAPVLSITDELLRLASEGVNLAAGYSENSDKVYAFASGGIPSNRIYMIGEEAGVSGTTAIPNDDLAAHVATVEALAPVCTP